MKLLTFDMKCVNEQNITVMLARSIERLFIHWII